MRKFITPDQALAEGVTPKELRNVAAWHGERSSKRHREAAKHLFHVADELERLLARPKRKAA